MKFKIFALLVVLPITPPFAAAIEQNSTLGSHVPVPLWTEDEKTDSRKVDADLTTQFNQELPSAGTNAVSSKGNCCSNGRGKSPQLLALEAADDLRISAMLAPNNQQFDAIFSDELHYAHSNGLVDTKKSLEETLVSRNTRYLGFYYEERNFSFPAADVALMTGRLRIKAQAGGTALDNRLSFLAIWRLEGGHWRFLAWQSCKLP
jgi:hypothetical protein